MAAFTLTSVRFPNGTTVKAYPTSNWPAPELPSGAPVGSSSAEAEMSGGALTFSGLIQGTHYWAVAEVGGVYRYVEFMAGEDTAGVLPPSVVNSSTAVLNAMDYLVPVTTNTIDFVALCKAMEEKRKSAVIPGNIVMKEQTLLNKQNLGAGTAKSSFQYRFIGVGPDRPTVTLPVMASGQFAFRCNQNAEGVHEDTSLYRHPDVLFEHLNFEGSGSADGGSVASSYRRTFNVIDCSLEKLANGFVEEQTTDRTFVNGLSSDNTVTGWCFQTEGGDAKIFQNIQAYGSKGLSAKHGSGVAIGLVSGIHAFAAAMFTLIECHLEGDGPNEASGKPSVPLLKFEGGVYKVVDSRLYTLTEPNRPAFEINDGGASERWTSLTFDNTRFLQRLDEPAAAGEAQPVGNLQGNAGTLTELSTQSTIKFIDTRGECFQQTTASSQFDTRSRIGLKFSTPSQAGLEAQLTNRRVMVSSTDCQLRYNVSTSSWEIRPIEGSQDSATTRRFGTPNLKLSKFAKESAGAKAAPTTRTATTHFYRAWALDDRGHKTNLSAEKEVTTGAGEVPVVGIEIGYPCRVVLEHGTSAGSFTEWVEIILPLGQAVLADMGSAIGGQAWSSSSLPTAPAEATSANNTVFGRQGLDATGIFEGYGLTAVYTTGEWQAVGDTLTLENGEKFVCAVAASANNGGTWKAMPSGLSTYRTIRQADGRGTTAAESSKKYFISPSAADVSGPGPGSVVELIQYIPSEFAVAGLTTKLKIDAIVFDSTALAKKITVGLYPVNNGASLSLGTVVTGSTVELEPEGNKAIPISSAEFTAPAEGVYALGYVVSGTPSGGFTVCAELKVHNT